MEISQTNLSGCVVIEPQIFEDERGYFFESFNLQEFNNALEKNLKFVQDNESFSTKGVLRGLHYQRGDYAQAKLVRVIKGHVLDVAVDLRPKSSTFGQYIAVELSEDNKKQLFIPRGFAHGFIVLSDNAIFSYKCDNYYNRASEGGIIYNDLTLDINWILNQEEIVVSEKDLELPTFEKALL